VRFAVDGRSYEFEHVEFVAMRLPDANRYFLALGQDPAKVNIVTAVPSGAIQWRMELASVYDLVERDMDLSDVNDPELGVAMQLSLTDDVGVHQDVESSLRLRIANMEDGYVEGSFSAVRLSYVSMTQDVFRRVDVSGDFRAKLRIQ
jgi:hypothetical protein